MRLLSITLRNYRVHKELVVRFDPWRTLIGGPNETGKSTLAEAAHRVLFLRAKTGGALRSEMQSTRHTGDPEVLLSFEACGARWELEKRFAGPKGSARLTGAAGATFRDDEAEAKLCEVLKCDTNGGRLSAAQLPMVWAHLWVWQGSSGADPSSHASSHKDTLVQRLQQDGLAAVMQSENDQRVRERIAASYDELFTATGKPKAGSKPELAKSALAAAEAGLQRVREISARLEQDAAEHVRAEKEIAAIDANLPELRKQRTATETKLAHVAELRRQEETHRQAWELAAADHKQRVENDAAIRQSRERAARDREALEPAEKAEADRVAADQKAREESHAAEIAQRERAADVRKTRLQDDFAAAAIAACEKAAEHDRLTSRTFEATAIRAEMAALQETLSKLPVLAKKELDELRKLDRAASQAGASLKGMASSIEILTADQPVTLDGQALAVGESRTLTDAGELAIGGGTRLRIRPGGGTSLSDARQQHETAARAFENALERRTLRDLDHATEVLQQRETIGQQLAQCDVRWKATGGESLATGLAAATADHEAAKAELERRSAALGAESTVAATAPATLDAARELRNSLQQALSKAESAEAAARHQADQLRQRAEKAAKELQSHRDQTAQSRQSLRDLETKLKVLEETHGDASSRQTALATARENEQRAASLLAATRQALADLSPDQLAADLERFNRAVAQQDARRREAENLRLVTRDRLTLDGSTDPHAELSHALARHAAAVEINVSEQRRAQAIARLHQLFADSREAIHRSLVQPLADRISGYLQCLFGPSAHARVKLNDHGFEGFDILRGDGSAFAFQSLSGGAKEQVAAAVRLAMAEILANDHDGCLPIVFDDAFAYTDPDRIQSLQRMLDLAATRGLQVVLLTCTPADYSAFGASELRF